jgi:hypothetical protein
MGIPDTSWQSISACVDRVRRAFEAEDLEHVVGAAKELAEAVAKSAIQLRGQPVGKNDDFNALLWRAHDVLGRQPGSGLSNAPALNRAMGQARHLASQLAPLRNEFGTGHGRAQVSEVTHEIRQERGDDDRAREGGPQGRTDRERAGQAACGQVRREQGARQGRPGHQ